MNTAVWYLLLLTPVFAIVYVLWAYRNKAAAKEAASRERLTALVGIVEGARAAGSAARKEQTAAPAVVSKPATDAARPAVRPRFLTQPETLMYYVLKAGLPDHEIFPRVSLASVIAAAENIPPSALAERRPARHEIDFVICDKSMQVVAAVQLDAQPGRQDVNQRLSAAGIRLVRFNPAALPRREQVRTLIFGQST